MATQFNPTERFRFEQRGVDANGDRLGPWAPAAGLGEVAGGLTLLRRGEAAIASRLQGQQPAVIKVWSNAKTLQVTTAWRAVHLRTGDVYDLQTREPGTDRRFIEFLAVADGQGGGV